MKSFIKLVSLLFLFTILISCNSNSIEPEPQAGRRDYVWTIDTLHPSNIYLGIWGTSPTDIWIISEGGSAYDRLQHFDGTKWSISNQPIYSANAICGFNKNNIWIAGGTSGTIQHYDGNQWSVNYIYKINGAKTVTINDIRGNSPDDIYAVGVVFYDASGYNQKGFILHYDGIMWREVYLSPDRIQFLRVINQNNKQYIGGIQNRITTPTDTLSFLEFDGMQLKKFYNDTQSSWCGLGKISSEVYFIIGNDVFTYHDEKFNKEFSITEPNFNWVIWGRNKNDIFVSMYDGIGHYDGNDFKYLYKFETNRIAPFDAILFDNEVFFIIHDWIHGENYVLKGKLKQ